MRKVITWSRRAAWPVLLLSGLGAQAAIRPRVERSTVRVHEGSGLVAQLSPDGQKVALLLLGSVYIADRATGVATALTDPRTEPDEFAGFAWSPDGQKLALVGGYQNPAGLAIHDMIGGTRTVVSRRGDIRDVEWTATGDLLVCVPSGDSLEVRRYASGSSTHSTTVTFLPRGAGAPALSPDGSALVYVSAVNASTLLPTAQSQLMEVVLATGARRPLTTPGTFDALPAWSPDGRMIAFHSTRAATNQVWIMARDGSDARSVTRDVDDVLRTQLSWTPDARAVAYTAHGRLYLAPLDGTTGVEVPFSATLHVARWSGLRRPEFPRPAEQRRARGITDPELSPDGRSVAFAALGDLWVASVSGGPPRRLTGTTIRDEQGPRWSPDGSRIAYVAVEPGRDPVLRLIDVADPTRDIATPVPVVGEEGFAWSPDGTRITYGDASGYGWADLETMVSTRIAPPRASISWLVGFNARSDTIVYAVPTMITDTIGPARPKWTFMRAPARDSAIGTPWQAVTSTAPLRMAWTNDLSRVAYTTAGVGYWTPAGSSAPPNRIADPSPRAISWSADGRLLLYISSGRLRLLDVGTGKARTLDVAPSYRTAASPPPLVVRNARVIDGHGTAPSAPTDVFIENGHIARLGTGLRVPSGTREVDGSGRTVIPGLFDLHTHLFRIAPSPLFLHYGVTSIRDLGTRAEWTLAQRERAETGTWLSPRIIMSGGQLTGDYGLGDRSDGLAREEVKDTPDAIAQGIDMISAAGADVVKVYFRNNGFDARTVDAAHRRGLSVTSHFLTPGNVARGLDGKEHAHLYYGGDGWTTAWREDALALAKASGMCVTPTLINYTFLSRGRSPTFAMDSTLFDDPSMRRFLQPFQVEMARTLMRTPLSPAAQATWNRRFAEDVENVRRLHAAGVRVGAGTDAGPDGWSLHAELELLVKSGMSPVEAIRAATYDAAVCAGVEHVLGSIEVGKLADLVLVDGDPSRDIRDARNVRLVILGGRAFTRDDLAAQASSPAGR